MVLLTGKLYKRVSLFTLSLVLAISGLGVAAPLYFSQIVHAASGLVFIDTNTNGFPDLGELTFSTIQAAVNAANPAGGDTIKVAAGGYNESLNITNPVILQSVGGIDVTTIKSLTIATSSVTVSGFTIEGVNASNVASANIFLNSGVSNITISNNKINVGPENSDSDNEVGLLTTSNLVNISDNLNVTGNIFQASNLSSYRAFYINPGVNNFTFSGNAITGNFAYTATTQAKNGLVENNTITGAGGSAGFRALGEPDPTVWGHTTFSGNTVSGVARGITVDEANNVTITGNTLSGNGIGVRVVAYSSLPFDITTISVHNNNLSGEDTYGVTNNEIATPTILNASSNWWGSATGPGDVGPGTGDKVSPNVNFTPWCTNDTCTTFSSDPTTTAATFVTSTTATVNGTNGASVGDDTSFWLGTTSAGPFTPSTNPASELPGGWNGVDSLTQPANAVFSHAYSGLTPNTPYYFVAWSLVGDTWYPGAILSFTTARIYTQADFTAFDGVDIGTDSYTVSSGITATYTGSNTIKLTGYAPIVTPWFNHAWTTHNYVTVGIKLPAGFTGTSVYDAGVMRYDDLTHYPDGYYSMGTGSTALATTGAAFGYLDYSFAADSNNTKKDGLVKLQVIWNANSTPEYYTIDITDLHLLTPAETAAPRVAITSPTLNQAINGRIVTIKGTATDTDFNYYYCYVEDSHGEVGARDASCTTTWHAVDTTGTLGTVTLPSGAPDGNYVAHLIAYDKAGNSKETTQPFMLDNTYPVQPVFTAPVNDLFTKTNFVTLTWANGDDSGLNQSGIKGYTIRYTFVPMDGGATVEWASGIITNGNPKTHSGTYGHGQGTYTMYVSTVDNAGNVSPESNPLVLNYDATVPVASIAAPTAGGVSGHILNIEGTATDANFNYYYCYVTNANGEVGIRDSQCTTAWSAGSLFHSAFAATATGTTAGHLGTVDLTGLSSGAYQVHLVAYDKAGNSTEATPVSFTLDNTNPVITLTGSDSMLLNVGETYKEPGYTTDDGSIVNVTSNVNTAVAGTYLITYSAVDDAGNTATKTRTVTVEDTKAPIITSNRTVTTITAPVLARTVAPVLQQPTGGQVLGATDTVADTTPVAETTAPTEATTNNDEGQVLGTEDTAKEDIPWYDAKLFGLAWYWWLLLAIAAIVAGWWLIAGRRRRDE